MILSRRLTVPILLVAVLTLLLGTSCAGLRGRIKASISGYVYMDGRPVQGTVLLRDANGGVVAQERTNMSGHFRISNISAGTYTLHYLNMQGIPYGGAVTVQVRLGRPEVVDIELSSTERIQFD